jgi:hypothetical protein
MKQNDGEMRTSQRARRGGVRGGATTLPASTLSNVMTREEKRTGIAALIILATMPTWGILSGWVLTVLWGWFLMPLGLPPVHLWHAVGLLIAVDLLTKEGQPLTTSEADKEWAREEPVEALKRVLLRSWGRPLILLALGWVAHALMTR